MRSLTAVWLGFAVVMAYGSIYPFDFQVQHLNGSALGTLLDNSSRWSGRGDILGNTLLFLPFGFFGIVSADADKSLSRRFFAIIFLGAVFALALQVAQVFLPSREENLQDVLWNIIGLLAGGSAGALILRYGRNASRQGSVALELVPCLLVASWLFYRLIPLVPSIDFQVIKDSLKPLLLHPHYNPASIFQNTTSWLVVAGLLQRVQHGINRDRYLWIIMLGVFGLEVIIVENDISVSNVAGALLAFGVWWGVLRRVNANAGILAGLLCMTIIIQGISPFVMRTLLEPFAWLPFQGLLGGSMYVNVLAVSQKVFLYGSLVYLLWQTTLNRRLAMLLSMIVVTLVEFAQVYVVGHTPEITDPLLLVLAALTMRALGETVDRPATGSIPKSSNGSDKFNHSN
jgi:VanZ family protein